MATFRNIQDLPTEFLKETISAAGKFLSEYPFQKLYMSPSGECAITFKGHMPEKAISVLLANLEPEIVVEIPVQYAVDYDYIEDETIVYTKDGRDYRTFSRFTGCA